MALLPKKFSFKFVSKKSQNSVAEISRTSTVKPIGGKKEKDSDKRLFLKVLGGAGLGFLLSSFAPKRADALILGSTPTSNVVGIRNIANNKINPATEDGNLATLASKDFAKESGGNLATIAAKDFATETTLSGIKTTSDKLQFDASNNLKVVTTGGGVAGNVGVMDTKSNQINPTSDESVILLRRMVKIMESQMVVDGAARQKVNVDSFGTNTTLLTGAGTAVGTPRVAIATDSAMVLPTGANVIGSLTNVATIAGQNQQMYQDVARNAYANGVRNNLKFS